MSRTAAPADMDCPNCGGLCLLVQSNSAYAHYRCRRCEAEPIIRRKVPGSIVEHLEQSRHDGYITLSCERGYGMSVPCPRCGRPDRVNVSAQGRRIEYECGVCNYGWCLPASPEDEL